MSGRNLTTGNHKLLIRKIIPNGAKVHVTLRPLDIDAREVLRTFEYRSKSLCVFLGRVLGRYIEAPNDYIFREAEGLVIVGAIAPARNPNYVNLVEVVDAFSRHQSDVLITKIQSSDMKTNSKKMRGLDA